MGLPDPLTDTTPHLPPLTTHTHTHTHTHTPAESYQLGIIMLQDTFVHRNILEGCVSRTVSKERQFWQGGAPPSPGTPSPPHQTHSPRPGGDCSDSRSPSDTGPELSLDTPPVGGHRHTLSSAVLRKSMAENICKKYSRVFIIP